MKICVATGTRAEYGLLRPLLNSINKEKDWELQLLVTGAHLSPEFGYTIKQIKEDGFFINKKVEMLLSSDTDSSIVKSMGLGMIGFADALNELRPDFIVILGDRYEMLAVASSSLIMKIPIIHISGGDITEGAYDDSIRHAITKMSTIHFPTTEQYRKRIIQMGENPQNVFNVGAIGIDNVKSLELLSKSELEDKLDIKLFKYNYLVTYHPETLSDISPQDQFAVLLDSLDVQKDSYFMFTYANADTGGRVINKMIEEYVSKHKANSKAIKSLGTLNFLSYVKQATAIIGNSSSGIVEAPSLKTATINIGERQRGRIQADSIVNVKMNKLELLAAFDKVKSEEFQLKVKQVVNPYGDGTTAQQIIEQIRKLETPYMNVKSFYNIKF